MTFEHKNWMLQPVEWEWQYNETSNLSVTYIPDVGTKFYCQELRYCLIQIFI